MAGEASRLRLPNLVTLELDFQFARTPGMDDELTPPIASMTPRF
jgi:hypothetical protein